MKKILITTLTVAISGCGITVPYFDDLDPKYVCGGKPSPYCQPTSSTEYSKIKNGLDYDGNPNHYLGRSFSVFFEREKCVDSEISNSDIIVSGYQKLTGTLKDESKTEFSNKMSADVVELLKLNGVPVPPGVKAEISTEVSKAINNTDTSSVSLEYRRIDLSTDYIDNNLDSCLKKTARNLDVSTGISVITVTGSWASDNLVKTLASVEASANYSVLSDSAKAKYDNTKERVLKGEFSPVSFIFAVAHRPGKQ